MIIIDKKKCPADHNCPLVILCPVKAITQTGFAAPEINTRICTECKRCVNHCVYKVFTYIEDEKA